MFAPLDSVFDVIGAGLVLPSDRQLKRAHQSGKLSRHLLPNTPIQIDGYLFGAKTQTSYYYGTVIAFIGGLLDLALNSPEFAQTLKLAHEAGIDVAFIPPKKQTNEPQIQINMKYQDKKMIQINGLLEQEDTLSFILNDHELLKLNISQSTTLFILSNHDNSLTEIKETLQINYLAKQSTITPFESNFMITIPSELLTTELLQTIKQLPAYKDCVIFA